MISIITAIYNQIGMNRLFLESVRNSTVSDWELIVLDNGSTDGSAEFFETADPRVRVIRNRGNYSYPYCQNQGIDTARGDVLAFLNNDIFLSPEWDKKILSMLGRDGFDALTLCSNDRMADTRESTAINRRYKRFKYPLLKILGRSPRTLRLLLGLTYGNFFNFCNRLQSRYSTTVCPGFTGSAVIMSRRALRLLGKFDPSQQGADFDLYFRSFERWRDHGDIRPLSMAAGVYHHHFSRLTAKCTYPQFEDVAVQSTLEAKWGEETMQKYIAAMQEMETVEL